MKHKGKVTHQRTPPLHYILTLNDYLVFTPCFPNTVTAKSKVVPPPPCRRQERGNNSSFLTQALDAVSGQRCATDALYPRERTSGARNRRLGGFQSWSGHRGYRKKPLPLPEIKHRSPCRLVYSQTLHWLNYPGSLF